MASPTPNSLSPDMAAGVTSRAASKPHQVSSVSIALPLHMTSLAMETYYGGKLAGPARPSMWRLIEVAASQPNPFTSAWCVGVATNEPASVEAPAAPARRRSRWSLFRM